MTGSTRNGVSSPEPLQVSPIVVPIIHSLVVGVDQGRYRADRTNTTLLGNIGMDFIDKPLGGVARVHFSIQG